MKGEKMSSTTYEFREWNEDDINIDLEFTVDDNTMNCYRFHDFCKRFAIAVGYMPSTVEKVFGETQYEEMFDI